MVWYFIGVCIINRTLQGHLEIRNFSSCVEKNIFQHSERNFVSLQGHVISSVNYYWSDKRSMPVLSIIFLKPIFFILYLIQMY